MYLSTDNGENWNIVGLKNLIIYNLAISGTNIYAGTSGGMYVSSNNGTTWSFIAYLGSSCITINN